MRRRRSLNPKPEPVVREQAVMIECFGITDDREVTVRIGNETYHFLVDGTGRRTAAVYVEDHIECFLARGDMYRPAGRQALY